MPTNKLRTVFYHPFLFKWPCKQMGLFLTFIVLHKFHHMNDGFTFSNSQNLLTHSRPSLMEIFGISVKGHTPQVGQHWPKGRVCEIWLDYEFYIDKNYCWKKKKIDGL